MSAAPKMVFFLHLAAEKKTPFFSLQLKQIFGPSYFDRALVALERNLSTPLYQRKSLVIEIFFNQNMTNMT